MTSFVKDFILFRVSKIEGITFWPSTLIFSFPSPRTAVCKTALFSVSLIIPPLNCLAIASSSLHSFAKSIRRFIVVLSTLFFEISTLKSFHSKLKLEGLDLDESKFLISLFSISLKWVFNLVRDSVLIGWFFLNSFNKIF